MALSGHACFLQKPRRIDELLNDFPGVEKQFTIAKTVQLTGIDFENFITDMIVSRDFIEKSSVCNDFSRCLLVVTQHKQFGIVAVTDGVDKLSWAAVYTL